MTNCLSSSLVLAFPPPHLTPIDLMGQTEVIAYNQCKAPLGRLKVGNIYICTYAAMSYGYKALVNGRSNYDSLNLHCHQISDAH